MAGWRKATDHREGSYLRSYGRSQAAIFPGDPGYRDHGSFGNSTTSMANMIIVNGPVRQEIGMNSGMAAMGPYNEANAVIGRAFTLLSKGRRKYSRRVTNFSSSGKQSPV